MQVDTAVLAIGLLAPMIQQWWEPQVSTAATMYMARLSSAVLALWIAIIVGAPGW